MNKLAHPIDFKCGVRVLLRDARNKDGAEQRKPARLISHNPEEFDAQLELLLSDLRAGERIYGSADARNWHRAVRHMKEKLLEADYSTPEATLAFYSRLDSHWKSALMQTHCRDSKLYLFDLDTMDEQREFAAFYEWLINVGNKDHNCNTKCVYSYATKNGSHKILLPFNPELIPKSLQGKKHTNAMMLWAYA